MNEPTLDTLTGRVERLERQVHWWRRGAMVIVALGVVVAIALTIRASGQTAPKSQVTEASPRVIEAEKFIVKDRDGKIRVILGPSMRGGSADFASAAAGFTLGDAYGLHAWERDGRYVIGLSEAGDKQGVWFELYDKTTPSSAHVIVASGLSSLSLSATETTREVAERRGAELDKRINAAKTEEERMKLMLSPTFDGITAKLVAFPKGSSLLALERGTLTNPQSSGAQLYLLQDGRVSFSLLDERGKERAVLGQTSLERKASGIVEQLPVSSLVLFDKEGKVLWKAP